MQNIVLFWLINFLMAIPVLSRFTADDAVGGVYVRKIKLISFLKI